MCYSLMLTLLIIITGIRSLSFKEDILTIGTGVGHVLFFDVNFVDYNYRYTTIEF
jgi:hypothetical protein